jgi:hypothetical protein
MKYTQLYAILVHLLLSPMNNPAFKIHIKPVILRKELVLIIKGALFNKT